MMYKRNINSNDISSLKNRKSCGIGLYPHNVVCAPPPCPSLSPFCFRLSWRSKAFPTQREHWRYAEHRQSLRPARAVAITSVRREASHDGPDTRQLLTAESTHVRPPGDSESHRIDSEGPQHSPCIPPGPLASPQTTGTRHAHTYNSRNGHTSEKGSMCPV